MIAAYSPQARGRSERNFGTWQGQLPQELRLCGITTVEQANQFLREQYVGEFNRRVAIRAAQEGTALVPCRRTDRDRVFAWQHERVVNRDPTVSLEGGVLQIEKTPWRATLAACRVTVYEPLDGTLRIGEGPHGVGHYTAPGRPLHSRTVARRDGAVEKTVASQPGKSLRDAHFPAAFISRHTQTL